MRRADPDGIRAAVTQGWEHLNLSYGQVMATRAYQFDGDPDGLPPVLAQRRTELIGARTGDTAPNQRPERGKVTQGGPGGRRKGKSR